MIRTNRVLRYLLHSLVFTATALASLLPISCARPRFPAPDPWWAHVRWLADDARQGRGTGTPGYQAAADYVAQEFRTAGARPAGTDGYFQPVRFIGRRIREPQCLLALVDGGRADTLALGEDAILSTANDPPDSLEADAVFAGFGLQVPGYDDLAGMNLRGKIVLFLRGGPASLPENVRAYGQNSGVRWARLRAAGAIGFATLGDPTVVSIPWARAAGNRFTWGYGLADTSLDEQYGQKFRIYVNPVHAQKFFEGSGHTFEEILAKAHKGEALPHFPLKRRIRARVRMDRREATSPNVVGIIEGSDPTLRGESIVLSAHLDHLGIGAPVQGDSIYNGAMDNASGVATLLEIARALGAPGARPRRSVVLLALAGEEEGLLGSYAFAKRPPPATGALVANLNLDMFLPIIPLRATVAYGIEESTLGERYRAVAESSGVAIAPDPAPAQTYFIRSDQFNFVRAGVPALFVEFGTPPGDSAEAKKLKEWTDTRYHAPSDDGRQPLNLVAARAFNRLLLRFTKDVANDRERPVWHQDSFFAGFARGEGKLAKR